MTARKLLTDAFQFHILKWTGDSGSDPERALFRSVPFVLVK
jgi:hypothetical protein